MTGEEVAKPVTTILDCVSSFVGATPLDISVETSGKFPAEFVATKGFTECMCNLMTSLFL